MIGVCVCVSRSQGDFTAIVDLGEGLYEYKFFVDGQWMHDPTEVCDEGCGLRWEWLLKVVWCVIVAEYGQWSWQSQQRGGRGEETF